MPTLQDKIEDRFRMIMNEIGVPQPQMNRLIEALPLDKKINIVLKTTKTKHRPLLFIEFFNHLKSTPCPQTFECVRRTYEHGLDHLGMLNGTTFLTDALATGRYTYEYLELVLLFQRAHVVFPPGLYGTVLAHVFMKMVRMKDFSSLHTFFFEWLNYNVASNTAIMARELLWSECCVGRSYACHIIRHVLAKSVVKDEYLFLWYVRDNMFISYLLFREDFILRISEKTNNMTNECINDNNNVGTTNNTTSTTTSMVNTINDTASMTNTINYTTNMTNDTANITNDITNHIINQSHLTTPTSTILLHLRQTNAITTHEYTKYIDEALHYSEYTESMFFMNVKKKIKEYLADESVRIAVELKEMEQAKCVKREMDVSDAVVNKEVNKERMVDGLSGMLAGKLNVNGSMNSSMKECVDGKDGKDGNVGMVSTVNGVVQPMSRCGTANMNGVSSTNKGSTGKGNGDNAGNKTAIDRTATSTGKVSDIDRTVNAENKEKIANMNSIDKLSGMEKVTNATNTTNVSSTDKVTNTVSTTSKASTGTVRKVRRPPSRRVNKSSTNEKILKWRRNTYRMVVVERKKCKVFDDYNENALVDRFTEEDFLPFIRCTRHSHTESSADSHSMHTAGIFSSKKSHALSIALGRIKESDCMFIDRIMRLEMVDENIVRQLLAYFPDSNETAMIRGSDRLGRAEMFFKTAITHIDTFHDCLKGILLAHLIRNTNLSTCMSQLTDTITALLNSPFLKELLHTTLFILNVIHRPPIDSLSIHSLSHLLTNDSLLSLALSKVSSTPPLVHGRVCNYDLISMQYMDMHALYVQVRHSQHAPLASMLARHEPAIRDIIGKYAVLTDVYERVNDYYGCVFDDKVMHLIGSLCMRIKERRTN